MTMIPRPVVAAALALLAARVPTAQELPFPEHAFRAPIHAAGAGEWSAGPDYKASFHDGFVYYPRLGARYRDNLPLRWRATTVTCAA